jgi:hypothetical protein
MGFFNFGIIWWGKCYGVIDSIFGLMGFFNFGIQSEIVVFFFLEYDNK